MTSPTTNITPVAKKKLGWVAYLIVIVLPFIIVIVLRSFLLGNYYIPSGSMENTLQIGDRMLVSLPDRANPQHGDIVVFKDNLNWLDSQYPTNDQYLVKRVIGLGGDTVYSDGKHVYVNGKALNEPYVVGTTTAFSKQKVPQGKFFALGDNRENSADSRAHIATGTQFISVNAIVGKAWLRYWPLNKLGTIPNG